MTITTYGVTGMTCAHCVGAVSREVTHVEGVRDVQIHLVPGGVSLVVVESLAPLDEPAVAAAVAEAGYELTGVLA
ncbi:MAG: heavy-metal-associated domain-containing protein [Cellulomonas sp.]|uniref:heavy-metal-associated domain-containing protein n=1 Tax=Cellulomonas sp. 73-92 TaxID=1895740 RepID=UPI00092A0D0C|nr:heavy-metal-associated domain-containing protein [Cellulomonas sp. 73-92]MBN9376671.1 heavy-metal-associated domain-containing protein [Cellulomonas sp.]OJV84625.1 MAG: heavy metal transporter [Cellulomonas sp. 73-92]